MSQTGSTSYSLFVNNITSGIYPYPSLLFSYFLLSLSTLVFSSRNKNSLWSLSAFRQIRKCPTCLHSPRQNVISWFRPLFSVSPYIHPTFLISSTCRNGRRDFAFVHYKQQNQAQRAVDNLDGSFLSIFISIISLHAPFSTNV